MEKDLVNSLLGRGIKGIVKLKLLKKTVNNPLRPLY